jgi:hypothetical protein
LDTPALQQRAAELEAEKFLKRNGGHLEQPVSLYRIDDLGLWGSEQPTTDGAALADEIAKGKDPVRIWQTPTGAVNTSPGIRLGSDGMLVDAAWRDLPPPVSALGTIVVRARRAPGRKLVFWFGPGWPIGQRSSKRLFDSITEFSTRMREARVELWNAELGPAGEGYEAFLEGVKTEKSASYGDLALQMIATQSGGGVLRGSVDVSDRIAAKVAKANWFYTLTFDPPPTSVVDEYHALKVQADNADVLVEAPTGYYDEPAFYYQHPANVEHVSVAQLEAALKAMTEQPEGDIIQRLLGMELTERLSSADLAQLINALKGKNARQALSALADRSAFQTPPAAEIPTTPAPTIEEQAQIASRAVDYVLKTLPTLPGFQVDRTTVLYHERLQEPGQTWKTAPVDQSLHAATTIKAAIVYRDGHEVVHAESKAASLAVSKRALDTVGTFGPILSTVLIAAMAPHGSLTWGRWEQGANGPLAVFRYRSSRDNTSYSVGFCCQAEDEAQAAFGMWAPFHGELTVDPASGAILRLTMEADLQPRLPLNHSDIMVEYGPVVLGDTTSICPLRSVSISRERTVVELREWGEHFKVYAAFETVLNDMTFEHYHLFRSTSRVLVPDLDHVSESK